MNRSFANFLQGAALFCALTIPESLRAEDGLNPEPSPMVVRSWVGHGVLEKINRSSLQDHLTPDPQEITMKLEEYLLDLGSPVKQLAFGPEGKSTFALMEDSQTVIQLRGGMPLEEAGRFRLAAPANSMVVLRDDLVFHQKGLGRLEFRPLVDLATTRHWQPAEGHEIRGLGLSPKEKRAPLVIWTRKAGKKVNYVHRFAFLDPKTLEPQRWKIADRDNGEELTGPYRLEFQWDGTLEKLEVSDDGLTARSKSFTLTFGRNQRVDYQPQSLDPFTDSRQFEGRPLPFRFSGFKILGESENHLLIAGPESAKSVAVFDREHLVPICLILGWQDKFDFRRGQQNFNGASAWSAIWNEKAGHLHLRQAGTARGFFYPFNPTEIRQRFPFQSCPSLLPLNEDEAGRMTFSFAATWEGDGHDFRLLKAPIGSSIDASSGEVTVPIPANQRPGSRLFVLAEGKHRNGTTVALQTTISIPYQK